MSEISIEKKYILDLSEKQYCLIIDGLDSLVTKERLVEKAIEDIKIILNIFKENR